MNICIFDKNKECNTYKNCDNCDLASKKIFDECLKSLDLNSVDIEAVNIEGISKEVEENELLLRDSMTEDSEESLELDKKLEIEFENNINFEGDVNGFDMKKFNEEFKLTDENGDAWEHIEYIDDLQDLLLDKEAVEKYSVEEFPGLIRINRAALEEDMNQ
ncbi:hypothetical protein SAMN02745163_01167 [Clostridium cavendishii DSM 21758]|uniref:Uncharacterized protein n=1 Tax=Clostridium cavendishii DSM 21758 TaxID=1121302 RepID=A0A1M6FKZ2_9CLOT|nr:hypothetical protein [Clostridium cavendishii]SHI98336.1 hypothetical protein SAMN02745163_01167 [Clostridium cavendishii DSM 21758]